MATMAGMGPLHRSSRKPHRRYGLTLTETLLVAAGLGLILLVLMLGLDNTRGELKRQQAENMLRELNRALQAYAAVEGDYPVLPPEPPDHQRLPSGSLPDPQAGEPVPRSGDRMIAVLVQNEPARDILDRLDEVLWVTPESPAARHWPLLSDWGTVQDPWGRRLRCLTAQDESELQRKAVAANQGRPIFISAGPDRRFGTIDIMAASDNIRSDEQPAVIEQERHLDGTE